MPAGREEAGLAPGLRIVQASAPAQIAHARGLFLDYAAWLKVDLCFQGFDRELAQLPGDYAPPDGRLYLVSVGADLAGCIALRLLEPNIGEIKRLYVRPAFRGRGIARKLTDELLASARASGYTRLRPDTLEFMHEAAKLYRSLD